MNNTKQYALIKLSDEHTMFLKIYATVINDRWYHLPNWYRQENGNYFEVYTPSEVPNEIKSSSQSENINAELLEALESLLDFDLRDLTAMISKGEMVTISYTTPQLMKAINAIKKCHGL